MPDLSSPVCLFCSSRLTAEFYLLDINKKEMKALDVDVSAFVMCCSLPLPIAWKCCRSLSSFVHNINKKCGNFLLLLQAKKKWEYLWIAFLIGLQSGFNFYQYSARGAWYVGTSATNATTARCSNHSNFLNFIGRRNHVFCVVICWTMALS